MEKYIFWSLRKLCRGIIRIIRVNIVREQAFISKMEPSQIIIRIDSLSFKWKKSLRKVPFVKIINSEDFLFILHFLYLSIKIKKN